MTVPVRSPEHEASVPDAVVAVSWSPDGTRAIVGGAAGGVWLVDAAGSVPANIEEGFGRGFGKDYARFLRIALGSCRETRGWYYRARHVFDADILAHRLQLADEVISGLVTTANQQRNRD
jgi:hypothetical protein